MRGKIEQLTQSKSGKAWRVLIDKRWFGAKFDSKLDTIPVGSFIDFDFNSDPKYGDWVTTWGPAVAGPVNPPTPKPVGELVRVPDSSRANGDRWWLPFVSNQTAHLIQVGVVKDRATLNQWMKDLKEAVMAVDAL